LFLNNFFRSFLNLGCARLFFAAALFPATAFAESSAENWQSTPFWCLQTELNPATVVFSKDRDLRLFTQATNSPVGPPAFMAFPNVAGLVISSNGPAINCSTMNECWAVVWYGGARGWTNWDSPWLIAFEHKPLRARLDSTGLKLRFGHEAGHVVMMPLYGYEKLLQDEESVRRLHSTSKIEIWKWSKGLPKDVVQRARYWSSVLREFPIHCAESFSVDRSRDSVTLRQSLQWLPIPDDWNTSPLPLHPVSPPLAQASLDKTFPVGFSSPPFDLDFFTTFGPLFGVEKKTSLDVTIPLLRFINEMEIPELPPANAPAVVTAALTKLRETAAQTFHDPIESDSDDSWYAKALPYYDEPTRVKALESLRKFLDQNVLAANRIELRDSQGLGANLLESLWAYAQHGGDLELIKAHWDLIKKLFAAPAERHWVGFGPNATAEIGDEAVPSLAMARLAYAVGDLETYNYATCRFVRALVHLQVKQRGADYFRRHQPWHSLENMGEDVFLTSLGADGWRIDGPKYPKQATERQFKSRWLRFSNEDVGRFYRDYWQADVRKELDLLETVGSPEARWQNDPNAMPSFLQLRSLLLNEAPEDLGKVALPKQSTGSPSGVIANCISILRTSHPAHYKRIIPKEKPSEFAPEIEREPFGPGAALAQTLRTQSNGTNAAEQSQWPELVWPSWRTPGRDGWSFGQIVAGDGRSFSSNQTIRLNRNTQVTICR